MPADLSSYLDRFVVAGGIIMFVLVPLSIISLGMIVQGFVRLRNGRVAPQSLVDTAKKVSSAEEYGAFRQSLIGHGAALAHATLDHLKSWEKGRPMDLDENPAPIEMAVDRLYQSLTLLGTIYTVAPLLGLLGTIMGMMDCFYEFANNAERDMRLLTVGINEALVTTMWGLSIAIPTYVFAAILRGRVFRYERDRIPEALIEILNSCADFALAKSGGASPKAPRSAPVSDG